MKLRRRFIALIAASMMATSMPAFATSTNRVDKIVPVAQDAKLDKALAPQLKIELKDELEKGKIFYLNLEDAEWADDIVSQLGTNSNFKFTRENKTQLSVEAKKDLPASELAHAISLITKVTGAEASVEIDSNDTAVTSGNYIFATSKDSSHKSKVTADDVTAFAITGEMAPITIEEQYIGAFKNSKAQKVTIDLKGKGIEFNHNKNAIIKDAFVGKKAYLGKKFSVKVMDEATLEVEIPANSLDANQVGALELKGIQIKASKDAVYGDVNAVVRGDLNETTEVTVAKYSDYGTELKVAKEYTAVAGQKLEGIEFTLSETVANSLRGNGKITFTFPKEVTIDHVEVKKHEGLKTGAVAPVIAITKKDGKNTNEFSVPSIEADGKDKASVTFKATLNVPGDFKENINLIVEGTSIEDKKEVLIAKAIAPTDSVVVPAIVKPGLKDQTGGKITLKETSDGNIAKGKILFALEDSEIRYAKAPEAKVIKGDLVVEPEVELVEGGFVVTVKSESSTPSTLEISQGKLTVGRLVAIGAYKVKIGGPALSIQSADEIWDKAKEKYNDIDELIEADFIIVDPNAANDSKNKATFVIGETKYTVNDTEKTMDTAPYLAKEGRTMLPVRYAADALGVNGDQILWDGESKTVTVVGDKVVQIKLASKEMVINKATVPMTAAAEIKNDRIFIPVAEIARALNANVDWDSVTKTATFN